MTEETLEMFGDSAKSLSPRLKWMERHHIATQKLMAVGDEPPAWAAVTWETGVEYFGSGKTELEAIYDLVAKTGLKLWNEEEV